MYRGYTQIFRIFGAVIIFYEILKFQHYSKFRKYQNSLFSPSSLTDSLGPFVSDTNRGTAVLPSPVGQNVPAVMLRRGRPHQHDLHHPANLSRPSEQQQAHRRKLYAGHGGHGGADTVADGTTPATTR